MVTEFAHEIAQGERFEFGQNWQRFLVTVTDEKIREAEQALQRLLTMESLAGKTFLDIGSGSGLHSLAARRLGAHVYSFDNDPQSVECTRTLKQHYYPDDPHWILSEGSALDQDFISTLGAFDLVYSWGVLHHTGHMWNAIRGAMHPVKANGGLLLIAIYNRHWTSKLWKEIKKWYNKSPALLQSCWLFSLCGIKFLGAFLTTRGASLKSERGMAFRVNMRDWLGGYPYEYASIQEIVHFVEAGGFETLRTIPTKGWTGCNQFVFRNIT